MGNKKPADAEKKVTLTPEEQAIALRVSKSQQDWDTIKEEDLVDFSLSVDSYALPEEAQELQNNKKFAFRYISMEPRRIDEVTNWLPPKKWWVANRTLCPYLAKYVDPVHGAIQKEDQILVMKPWNLHERYENSKHGKAVEQDKKGALEHKHGKKEELEPGILRTETKAGSEYKIGGADVVMESD